MSKYPKKNKYAETAVIAAKYVNAGLPPRSAWEKASCEIFIPNSFSQKKGCPRNAFLGLYGGTGKNAEYAQKALKILKSGNTNISERDLWQIVTGNSGKAYNSQMHVVKALFDEGLV